MSVVENSAMKEITSSEREEKKYINYLQTIAAVSLATIVLELILLIVHRAGGISSNIGGRTVKIDFCITSIVLLAVVALLSLCFTTEWQFWKPIDDYFNYARKDHAVTALFFLHMILVAMYIFQDSGVKSSCISSILLLDTSFGYFFSSKAKIRIGVSVICFVLYSVLLIFYFDQGKVFHKPTITIFPYLLAIIFVFFFNGIIYKRIIKEALEQIQKN